MVLLKCSLAHGVENFIFYEYHYTGRIATDVMV